MDPEDVPTSEMIDLQARGQGGEAVGSGTLCLPGYRCRYCVSTRADMAALVGQFLALREELTAAHAELDRVRSEMLRLHPDAQVGTP